MILLIDNYDSFSYNLYQLAGSINPDMKVIRNDEMTIDEICALAPASIILSPGPGRPEQAGRCMEIVEKLGGEIPILGVCLGHQSLGQAYGGNVIRAGRIMHGKTSRIRHEGRGVFAGLPDAYEATRYHSLVIDPSTLPDGFEVTAWSDTQEIMGIRHREWDLEGVQFHPESILSEQGHALLANFLNR